MRIECRTNLDWYKGISFPELTFVPRKTEFVSVAEKYVYFCIQNKIPTTLQVKNVTYESDVVVIELWYSERDTEYGDIKHLMKQ